MKNLSALISLQLAGPYGAIVKLAQFNDIILDNLEIRTQIEITWDDLGKMPHDKLGTIGIAHLGIIKVCGW